MSENWRANFNKIASVSDADWDVMARRLQKVRFKKKEIILKYGAVENYISFVNKGIVRYTFLRDGQNVSFNFHFPNSAFSAYDSFLLRMPTEYQIQAVTDVELLRISYDDIQEVYKESGVGNTIARKIVEGLYIAKVRRELSLLTEDAETRYRRLLQEWPELVKQLPLKDIASYIGITPQALSRIRRIVL
ncbi:Cyclic nucleotide-binding domain protein [compost metagenome]